MRPLLVCLLAGSALAAGCLGDGVPLPDDGPDPSPTGDVDPDAGGDEDGNSTSTPTPSSPAGEDPPPSEDPPASRPTPQDHGPWPALDDARIRPGVQITIPLDGATGYCTSNFIFRSPDNSTLYVGVAAHCVATGDSTSTYGCDPENPALPMGSEVRISGARRPGVLVYSGWAAMQAAAVDDDDTCFGNDFALIAIDPEDRGAVHPAMLQFGGPTGVADSGGVGTGDKVITYGNSPTRGGIDLINRHEGYVTRKMDTWTTEAYTVTPGIPGDSGSGVLTGNGQALGVLSWIEFYPLTGANGIIALDKALAYAAERGTPVELVTWELLDPGLLP